MIVRSRYRMQIGLVAVAVSLGAVAVATARDAIAGSVPAPASEFVPLSATRMVYSGVDVADASSHKAESTDLSGELEGHLVHAAATEVRFETPQYFPSMWGDTFFNTVGSGGDIIATANDTRGVDTSCGARGSNIALIRVRGTTPRSLRLSTINCMTSFGSIAASKNSRDGCTWKTGGITRIGRVLYLAIARQLWKCSDGLQRNGLQPSFNASIIRSRDDGRTWINPWRVTSRTGAAPAWDRKRRRYQAMFPGKTFPAPFFIQYGPGNVRTANGAGRYLYAVSTDGYAYDGNFLHLARVPLNKIQTASAWRYYHGAIGGPGERWTRSPAGATRVLQARHRLSQPAIQYVPAIRRYVLVTFYFTQHGSDFPTLAQTPYTRFEFFTAPKPWGPWTHVYEHSTQRNLWCAASPCPLVRRPGSTTLRIGKPDDWLGFYDPALVQKFVFTRPLSDQAVFTSGDWKNRSRYPGENLYRLHAVPFDLRTVLHS